MLYYLLNDKKNLIHIGAISMYICVEDGLTGAIFSSCFLILCVVNQIPSFMEMILFFELAIIIFAISLVPFLKKIAPNDCKGILVVSIFLKFVILLLFSLISTRVALIVDSVTNLLFIIAKNTFWKNIGIDTLIENDKKNELKLDTDSELKTVRKKVKPANFDSIFENNENQILREFIKKNLAKIGVKLSDNLIAPKALVQKNILNIIWAALVFAFISSVFFHFPIYTYIIETVILIMFCKINNKFDLVEYLEKEIKARPSEKMLNIIMLTKNSLVKDNSKQWKTFYVLTSIFLALIIFITPRIMYEEVDGGYGVRFYTFGVTNFMSATIPETYNGKNVVALRGNAFSNMFALLKVDLPDTITKINGQAFKNDFLLTDVHLSERLEYLGGGAFYNCILLKNIELPDTLNYMGGEAFCNAYSLTSVKLSSSLSEIRGDTFKNCESLNKISIPDNVYRIGGHAFYGNRSLTEVTFTQNSKLAEIGSSAFRRCSKLSSITIPKGIDVNKRAFKESPTVIKYFEKL